MSGDNTMTSSKKDTVNTGGEENNGFLKTRKPLAQEIQDMDELFVKLGDPGQLQTIWFFLLACCFLTVAPNAVVGVFFSYSPAHICNATVDWSDVLQTSNPPGLVSLTYQDPSPTSSSSVKSSPRSSSDQGGSKFDNLTSPRANLTLRPMTYYSLPSQPRSAEVSTDLNETRAILGIVQYGECSVNLTFNESLAAQRARQTTVSRACGAGEWVYETTGREASAVTDFDLVCEHRFLTDLASTLYYLGLMLANMTLGYASDVLGRRPVILIALHLILLTGIGIAFANSFLMFAFLRIIMGLLCQGLQTSSFVMAIELFPVHHRGRAGSVVQVFWGLGCLYLSAVAWFAQDWRTIQLALLVPTVFSALSLWFIGESLRWMLAKGKTQRASKSIERTSTFNKVTNPISGDDHCVLAEYKVHCVKHRSSYLDLVRTPQMCRRTISLSLVMFGVNFGYFGMTFNNAELAGNRYLNFFLNSMAETIAYTLGAFVVMRFGRKRSLIVCLVLGSACCLISGVIPRSGGVNDILIMTFSILGRFAMAACYCASDTYTAELFPTIVRNMGVGVCTLVGRFGSALAPQVSALRHVAFPQLPPLIFAAFAFAGAMLILLLPETVGQRLPDSIEDVEGNSVRRDSNSNFSQFKPKSNRDVQMESFVRNDVS